MSGKKYRKIISDMFSKLENEREQIIEQTIEIRKVMLVDKFLNIKLEKIIDALDRQRCVLRKAKEATELVKKEGRNEK